VIKEGKKEEEEKKTKTIHISFKEDADTFMTLICPS
jgi:hypothetical protein